MLYKTVLSGSDYDVDTFTKEFPSQISDWVATDVVYDKDVIASLDPDKTVYKTYHSEGSPPITLFLACYNTFEKADLSHSPIVCFTGQGWDVLETNTEIIDFGNLGRGSLKLNQMTQYKAGIRLITYYWYQSQKRAFSNRAFQKIYLFLEKLLGNSEKNAFVRLTLTVPQDKSMGDSVRILDDFTRDLYQELRGYFN